MGGRNGSAVRGCSAGDGGPALQPGGGTARESAAERQGSQAACHTGGTDEVHG